MHIIVADFLNSFVAISSATITTIVYKEYRENLAGEKTSRLRRNIYTVHVFLSLEPQRSPNFAAVGLRKNKVLMTVYP